MIIKEKVGIPLPSKSLRNFGKTLQIPLINCEINIKITWSNK